LSTLSALLQERLIPHLQLPDVKGMVPAGYHSEGTWILPHELSMVNPCMRVSKYQPGQRFAKHRDNGFTFSDDFRSIYTVLLYLNDDFEGGETVFFDEKNNSRFAITPEKGMCCVFSHETMHEGQVVSKGEKYILRTDLMFQRVSDFVSPTVLSPEYVEAERLYQLAITYQKDAQLQASTEAFRQAMAIHAQLESSRNQMRRTNQKDPLIATCLPRVIWHKILFLLSLQDICSQVALVNSFFYSVTQDSVFWFQKYCQHFHSFQNPYIVKNVAPEHKSWLLLFKYRYLAEHNFDCVAVDETCNFISCGSGLFSSRIGNSCGHLWHMRAGMWNILVGPDIEVPYDAHGDPDLSVFQLERVYYGRKDVVSEVRDEGAYAYLVDENVNIFNYLGHWVDYDGNDSGLPEKYEIPTQFNAIAAAICARYGLSVVKEPFDQYFGDEFKHRRNAVPLMVVVAPFGAAAPHRELFYSCLRWILPVCPFFCIISISEILVHYYNVKSCVVINVADSGVCTSTVVRGKEDEESIQYLQFEKTCIKYPVQKEVALSEDQTKAALAKLVEEKKGAICDAVMAQVERTKFQQVICGGRLMTDAIYQAFVHERFTLLKPHDEWADVHQIAIDAFVAAPTTRDLFRSHEIPERWK
jgi:hypothetical protein